MPEPIPYGQEPARLLAGKHLIAYRFGSHYSIELPVFNREAVEIIRMVPTAHWERSDGAWYVRTSRHEALQKAMDRIAAIPGMDRAPGQRHGADTEAAAKPAVKPQRTLILADTPCEIGQIMTYRRKPVAVEHLGRPFMADARYAKWGKPELCGAMVRYASHHPASPEEIAAWDRKLEERRLAAEETAAPEPEF